MLAAVVNTQDLLWTVIAAFVSSLAVALVASLGIWGLTKYADFNLEGQGLRAGLALGVGVFGVAATLGIIALGIFMMVAG